MMLIPDHREVPQGVVEDRGRPPSELERGERERLAGELRLHLLAMIVIDVTVAAGPYEVADVEVALLRKHVREERVARDVERDAQEDISAALVELAAETGASALLARRPDVELEERMAGHEGHLLKIGHVPGADDDAARVGIIVKQAHDLGDLVDVAAVRRRPAAPLHAVDGTEVAVLACPLVPDRDAPLLQPAD